MPDEVLVLSSNDIKNLVSFQDSIGAVEEAFRQYGLNKVQNLPSQVLRVAEYGFEQVIKSGYVGGGSEKSLGTKLIIWHPPMTGLKNPQMKSLKAVLLVFDGESGNLVAIMDGATVTKLRTGAVVGVATKYLAGKNARSLGVIGTGMQGRSSLLAVNCIRNIQEIKVYDVRPEQGKMFCDEMSNLLSMEIHAVDRAVEVVQGSDIVCTATTSTKPVFESEWVQEGTHINSVGGGLGVDSTELDPNLFSKAKVVVDSIKACMEEAKTLDVDTVFCLTYKPRFFEKQGFAVVEKEELPRKVWGECYRCPKYPDCDEIAMISYLKKETAK